MSDSLAPFSISRLSHGQYRIFDGLATHVFQIDFAQPPAASRTELIKAAWALPGAATPDGKIQAEAFARQAHEVLAQGAEHYGPTDQELSIAYDRAYPGGRPVMVCMAEVAPKKVSWLWPNRIPLGRITLVVGRPGEGKSFLTTCMGAHVTTGTPWPDEQACPTGSVIFICAEDDPGDTIRPRLDAHGADCRKVHLLTMTARVVADGTTRARMFTLSDISEFEKALKTHPDCRLVVIDPIGSFLGGDMDAHRDNECRAVLAPVAQLAEKYGVAVVMVAHRRKSNGTSADDLVLGSRAFTGIARAVWHLSRDPANKDRRLLLPGKNNLSVEGDGLAFTIEGDPPRLCWEREPVPLSADEGLMAENLAEGAGRPGPAPEARAAATDWLRQRLAAGPAEAKDIQADASGAKLKWRTVQRAAEDLNVVRERPAMGLGWRWSLPHGASVPSHVPTSLNHGALGILACAKNSNERADLSGSSREDAKLFPLGGNGAPSRRLDPSMRTLNTAEGGSDD